jgi:hypothetical protein
MPQMIVKEKKYIYIYKTIIFLEVYPSYSRFTVKIYDPVQHSNQITLSISDNTLKTIPCETQQAEKPSPIRAAETSTYLGAS